MWLVLPPVLAGAVLAGALVQSLGMQWAFESVMEAHSLLELPK